jgi:Zn-dependent peptidase ImmA (M78 family)
VGQDEVAKPLSPELWAISLSHLLNAALGADHFPINVVEIAKEYSAQRFPNDPITCVAGDNLPSFDGALLPAPPGQKGWGIFYNKAVSSKGRINFTLAHEFGHYLLHREKFPNGLKCDSQDVTRWESEYRQIEHQANKFAANFLMPLDDFRRRIDSRYEVNIDQLSACADRYGVSFIAACMRWIEYTERRAVMVISKDGYILRARSSQRALKTGAYFRTSGTPIEVSARAVALHNDAVRGRVCVEHASNVWLNEACSEIAVVSDQYEFTVSLLQLSNTVEYSRDEVEETREDDLSDRIKANHGLK